MRIRILFFLTNLNVSNNQLTSLDLSNCPYVDTFFCSGNQLSQLDLSTIPLLTNLDCSNNQISNLSFSGLNTDTFFSNSFKY